MEDIKYVNGIEQVNIGTKDKPYYIPKPTEEYKKVIQNMLKQRK